MLCVPTKVCDQVFSCQNSAVLVHSSGKGTEMFVPDFVGRKHAYKTFSLNNMRNLKCSPSFRRDCIFPFILLRLVLTARCSTCGHSASLPVTDVQSALMRNVHRRRRRALFCGLRSQCVLTPTLYSHPPDEGIWH